MNRNSLALLVVVLLVAGAAIGYVVYREQHRNTVEIEVSPNGIKVGTP